MGFSANVLKVMIASPSDVGQERNIVTEEVHRWNGVNAVARGLILLPIKWETHSSPQMGAHPQKIINDRLLLDADIVVGIFGTRIGTATPDYISGTVEEVKRHVAAGKLAMLYFSRVPVDPTLIDHSQWTALQQFKQDCEIGGLYAEYGSHEAFRTDFAQHLAIELNRPQYTWLARPQENVDPLDPELTDDEKRLLIAAAADRNGQVMTGSTMGGFFVQANNQNFVEDTPRSEAAWKRVVRHLDEMGYIEDDFGAGTYQLTGEGFARADKAISAMPLELSLFFSGPPEGQKLLVSASKQITLARLELLTSSEVFVTGADLDQSMTSSGIPLDPKMTAELFDAPRTDRNHSDHAGPAALRLVFSANGRRREVVLPINIERVFVGGTGGVYLTGSKTYTVE